MTDLFSILLEQSLTACWVIPAVLLLRFCLKKAPRRVTNLLWLVVAFRLSCPVSFESGLSLVTQAKNLSHVAAELRDEMEAYRPVDSQPTVTLPEDMVFDTPTTPTLPVEPIVPSQTQQEQPVEQPDVVITPEETPREQPFISRQLVLRAGCGIWLAGLCAMALFGLLSTRQWRRRVQTAVRCEDGLWRSEKVESPFILGVLRPRIYLPFVLPFGTESHVIAHEQAHLKRRDPLWKCLAFGLLSVYWFHPLVWVGYFLFCRDIELACDQQVTRELDAEGKKAYSRALLACTVSHDPLLCPLSFGEVGVKDRVKAVLRKKPGKLFSLLALALCTVLIICCAADPREEHPWDEAYRRTLEELVLRYGANEEYGLRSVTTLDLWEDGVPELVVFRKQDESYEMVEIYEYADGQAVPRADFTVSEPSYHAAGGQLLWKQTENGPCFAAYTPNTDTSKYANSQCLRVFSLDQQEDPVADEYYEMYDGRWYRDDGTVYGDIKAVFPEEEAMNALLSGWEDLSDRDWNGFLRRHRGALSYQRVYGKILEEEIFYSDNYLLVDMELDGLPELLTDGNGTVLLYGFDRKKQKAELLFSRPVAEGQYYWLDMTETYPVLVVEQHGEMREQFDVVASDGSRFRSGTLTARGGPWWSRESLSEHIASGDFFGDRAGSLSAGDYEALRISLLENADRMDPHEEVFGTGTGFSGFLHQLEDCSADVTEPKEKQELPTEYADVLTALIRQYGMFHEDEKTDLILGLKYAGLHRLWGLENPALVTLVNTRDEEELLHFTLRVYGTDGLTPRLLYETELGGRYGQTDVSHTFNVGTNVITYHTTSEWTEEIIHIYDPSNGTKVLRAVTNGQNEAPTRDALEQFWLDGEAISQYHYTIETAPYLQDSTEYDVCWNVAPASRADLEAFLNKMGVVSHSYAPAGYGETAAAAHHSRLSGLMAVHGTTPDGIVGATIVDLEQDGVPELLVQHGMALELYRYEGNLSALVWSGPIGLYFGQSDVSHQYVINTHGEQPCIIVYDAEESWFEEVIRVITLKDGIVGEEVLRAWTDENPDFPERENLDRFTINGKTVSDIKYDRRREELLDGGMTVSAVHPHAYPNSDEYMAHLLNQLAAGNFPEIGDSAARGVAWWLMSTNDGEPLDEQTALKFGNAFAHSAESPLGSFPDSLLTGPSGGVFDFCRYTSVDGQFWLILIDREDTTLVCQGIAYRFDENGALRVGVGFLNVDTFDATLVGDFDGQTLVHRRYHTDCYSGMEGCEDCFRSDLILWNADRTQAVKLLKDLPLANHFEVVSRQKNIVTVTYQTGPAHSEYDKVITLQIDLGKKTCIQTGGE